MGRYLANPGAILGALTGPAVTSGQATAGILGENLLPAFGSLFASGTRAINLQADANLARVRGDRALRDFQLDSQRQFGRLLALAGAGGQGVQSSADVIAFGRSELARGETRLQQNTRLEVGSLLRSAKSTRRRGFTNFLSDLSTGLTGAVNDLTALTNSRV